MQFVQFLPLLLSICVAAILLKVFHTQSLPSVTFTVNVGGIIYILKGKSHMTNATIDNTVTVSAAFTDKSGNAVAPAVAPIWTVDNLAVAVVAPAADGMSAVVTPVGPMGTAVVTVTAGSIIGSTSLTFAAGAPVSVVLTDVVNAAVVPAPAV